MMQGIFAAQAASSDSPSQTITRVNLALYRRGIESRFVTLMYGAMKPTAGPTATPDTIRHSSFRDRDRGRRFGGSNAAALSWPVRLRDVQRGNGHAEPGRRLIVFSDGVSEAMSASGEEYGESQSSSGAQQRRTASNARSALCRCAREPAAARPRATTSPRWSCGTEIGRAAAGASRPRSPGGLDRPGDRALERDL
jgi:hypothetical protein